MEYRIDNTGRPVYRCFNDFGPLMNMKNISHIVDSGTAIRLDSEDAHGIYPIHPDHYRVPDVIHVWLEDECRYMEHGCSCSFYVSR